MNRNPCVYILARHRNATLYTGVTSDLPRRIKEHRSGHPGSFTARYGVQQLVWFEYHPNMASAIDREKQIKKWRRVWKLQLIEESNPLWEDLAELGQV